jgi:hypothetical protein
VSCLMLALVIASLLPLFCTMRELENESKLS